MRQETVDDETVEAAIDFIKRQTKAGKPWKLVYNEAFNERAAAVSRERQLKNWKSRVRLEELIKKGTKQ